MCLSGYWILILSFQLEKLNNCSSVARAGGDGGGGGGSGSGGDGGVIFCSIPGTQSPDNRFRLFQKQLSA